MADKVMSVAEVIGELRSGMTIGIGGWGSRRKPMALVRAILRSDLTDLTIVSYGGPDVGLLVAAGRVRRVVCGFVSLDSIPLEPHFRQGRQQGTVELTELDEGMLYWGLLAAAHRLPFLPIRAGLGSDVMRVNPQLRTVRSPYADGEELVAMPALQPGRGPGPPEPGRPARQRAVPRPRPVLRRPVLPRRRAPVPVLRAPGPHRGPARRRAGAEPADQPDDGRRCRRDAARRPLHQLRSRLRPRRGLPAGVRGVGGEPAGLGAVPGQVPRRGRGRVPGGDRP